MCIRDSPCMVWVYNTSGGNFVKRISNLTFMTQPEDAAMNLSLIHI